MGRPSLADERRPQLLEAYADCLMRFGVEGTTLDRVAKQAGVTRGLVRHYLGNREEVVRALGDWARAGYLERFEEIERRHAPGDAEAVFMDLWNTEGPDRLVAVLDALFAEAGRDPYIAEVLRDVYDAFYRWMLDLLVRGFPDAEPAARRQVALILLSLGWADSGFEVIAFRPSRVREYRAITARLLDSLR